MRRLLKNPKIRGALMAVCVMSILTVTAFATDPETTTTAIDSAAIITAFTTGFNSMVVNSINMITAMVPIALTLAGTLFLVKKAMKWFRATSNG